MFRFRLSEIAFFAFLLGACNNEPATSLDPLERNLVWSGRNRSELEKVIAHYKEKPEDSLKLRSAIFLISNMENNRHYSGDWVEQFNPLFARIGNLNNSEVALLKDSIESKIGKQEENELGIRNELTTIKASYLIENIDQAYDSWQSAPWANSVSFNAFCNYILPYKSTTETPEEWRTTLRSRYQYIMDNPLVKQKMDAVICELIAEQKKWFGYTELFSDYPSALSIHSILNGHKGACGEMANLGVYSGRALGIPVAIDFTPQWANHSEGHIWNALITSDSGFISFLGAESRPGDYYTVTRGETKLAKAFRKTLGINPTSFPARAAKLGITDLPRTLRDPRLLDVTDHYTETADVALTIKAKNNTPVYLCIFQQGGWRPMDGGFANNNKVIVERMGTEILYMPMYYQSDQLKVAGKPFIFSREGKVMEIESNDSNPFDIKIIRKYPLKKYRAKWVLAEYLIRSQYEGSDSPDFKKSTLLYKAPEPMSWYHKDNINGPLDRDKIRYEMLWEKAMIQVKDSFRYVRMMAAPTIPFKLGELEFFADQDTIPLTGTPIGSVPHPERAFDGLPGYSIIKEDELETDRWVGLDLGRKRKITQIRYLAANDKNQVEPGKTYELFYWNKEWVSLGIKKSEGHQLSYTQIPGNALYWLHCKDCNSKEERPFTYENNREIWW